MDKKWRFCKSIACEHLKGQECQVEQCQHPDMAQALKERRAQLMEVKNGR
ncbi:MAG: hypothetical protein KKD44_26310 [Proteobacteria bacterium]|nr:hypothetical protein [Pseudomonadota bacterium]